MPHWGWGEAPPYQPANRCRTLRGRCRSAPSRWSATSREYEFTAELLLCSSDVEAYALRELLALADERDARAVGRAEPRLHRDGRATRCCAPRSPRCTPGSRPTTCSSSRARRRRSSPSPRRRWAPTTTPSSSRRPTSRCTRSRAPRARRSARVELEHERGWALDLDDVRRALRPDTRAIVVNFPHNPTGAHIDRATLDGLVEIAEEAGAHLFSDEVYRWLEHAPAALLPGAAELSRPRAEPRRDVEDLRACPGCASAGWRAATASCWRASRRIKDYTTICNSAPERDPRAHRAAAARRRRGPQPRASSTPTCRCSTTSSRAGTAPSSGSARAARPSASRGCSPTSPIDDFARELRRRGGRAAAAGLDLRASAATTSASASAGATCPRRSRRLERFAGARL